MAVAQTDHFELLTVAQSYSVVLATSAQTHSVLLTAALALDVAVALAGKTRMLDERKKRENEDVG